MHGKLLQGREKVVVGYVCDKSVAVGILFLSRHSLGIFSLVASLAL
jgi:hypothetical protein